MRRLAPDVVADLSGSELGDARLNARLRQLAGTVAASPAKSFPKLATSDAELEATYRFLNNPRVTAAGILEPHFRATVSRCSDFQSVLVVHDTTVFLFDGENRRPGLGWIKGTGQGFLGHFAMAVAPDGSQRPLGVIGVETLFRDVRKHMGRREWRDRHADPTKERLRWLRLMTEVEDRMAASARPIHVMDREADSFELIAGMLAQRGRFVVRATYDRRLAESTKTNIVKASDVLAAVDDVLEREVPICRRIKRKKSGQTNRIHPPRNARMAKLRVRATNIEIKRQAGAQYEGLPRTVPVNIVWVHEIDPPPDEPAVEWTLLTTEPIDTAAHVAAVVDYYRARWIIEDYFKALKTGCNFERRQLENRAALTNALAIFAPVAWRMLALRSAARLDSATPAAQVLTPIQLRLLRWKSKRVPLSDAPSAYEAMLAVAGLGGHLKRNGDPGWQTIGRGMDDLLLMEAGWAAREALEAEM